MTRNDILSIAVGGIAVAAASFFLGVVYTKKKYGIETWEEDDMNFLAEYADTDGDLVITSPSSRQYNPVDKPDIFEVAAQAKNDYTSYVKDKLEDVKEAINNGVEKVNTEISVVEENIFDTAERSNIVTENTAKDLVANGYDTLTATYFVHDDILAGFDNDLEKLDESEYGLDEGVQALMNSKDISKAVFIKNEDEKLVYELVASSDSYEEAVKEAE